MRLYNLSRITRLSRLHYFIPLVHGDLWLQTLLHTSIGTPNSLPFAFSRLRGMNGSLSIATCISQAHLSIVFFADTLTYEKIF